MSYVPVGTNLSGYTPPNTLASPRPWLAPQAAQPPSSASRLLGLAGPVSAAAGIGLGVYQSLASGLRGVPLQAGIARNLVETALWSIPGVNAVFGIGALVSALMGSTLSEYQRREAIENPGYLGPPLDLADALSAWAGANPSQLAEFGRLSDARAAARLGERVAFDPRTGAGQSLRTVRTESDPGRVPEVRRVEALQSVRFTGLPSIFSRRTRMN